MPQTFCRLFHFFDFETSSETVVFFACVRVADARANRKRPLNQMSGSPKERIKVCAIVSSVCACAVRRKPASRQSGIKIKIKIGIKQRSPNGSEVHKLPWNRG